MIVMIEDWQYYHELGHGIIAHIFDGYILEFKYLTFDDSEVKAQNFNSRDLGYTVALPIANMNDIVDEDIQKAALIDGMYLLSGIIGATFLGKEQMDKLIDITPYNFNKILDLRGTDGDFEIISKERRPFGFLISNTNLSQAETLILHCKLYSILLETFNRKEIKDGASTLYKKLLVSKKLLPQDFQSVFNSEITNSVNAEICLKISKEQFGNLLQVKK
jgi:hypothetical protein